VLAQALRLHWMFAYLFVLNGSLYVIGLLCGGGWRALWLRVSDLREAPAVARHYVMLAVSFGRNRKVGTPKQRNKYNALQRGAYFAVGVAGLLAVLSGWAIHKPVQLGWLATLFAEYEGARKCHFWLMIFFIVFTVPHVVLVFADGWDTFRSMITGWTERVDHHGE
jgi:thiosulfate reductase cytochrome b subunit